MRKIDEKDQQKKKVLFLCNGEKEGCNKKYCYKNTSDNPCRHTSDIESALNFSVEKRGEKAVYTEVQEERKMKKEVVEEINNFALRVLKGGPEVNMQETAILPEILHILNSLPDEGADREAN